MDGPENNYGYKLLPGWDPNAPDILPLGTRVKIRHFGGTKGKVIEWRGPLGVGGKQIYRIGYKLNGRRQFIEVPRDFLIVLPPKAPKPAAEASDAPPASPPS
ncbi:MAG: hypothetical protein K2X87_25815 [Gemmataceae bacterium]|nr:hypothetical protein [Gemmataceae bacterium]